MTLSIIKENIVSPQGLRHGAHGEAPKPFGRDLPDRRGDVLAAGVMVGACGAGDLLVYIPNICYVWRL